MHSCPRDEVDRATQKFFQSQLYAGELDQVRGSMKFDQQVDIAVALRPITRRGTELSQRLDAQSVQFGLQKRQFASESRHASWSDHITGPATAWLRLHRLRRDVGNGFGGAGRVGKDADRRFRAALPAL